MEPNTCSGSVTVLFNLSFTEVPEVIRDFIRTQQTPFIASLNSLGLQRLEWYLDEAQKKATVIEVFQDTDALERLVDNVIGTPINQRFGEPFSVDSFTVLGKMPDDLRATLGGMNASERGYVGGVAN